MKTCPICDEPRTGPLCNACTSWHYRASIMTPSQLAAYYERGKLRSKRLVGRLGRLRGNIVPFRRRRAS